MPLRVFTGASSGIGAALAPLRRRRATPAWSAAARPLDELAQPARRVIAVYRLDVAAPGALAEAAADFMAASGCCSTW